MVHRKFKIDTKLPSPGTRTKREVPAHKWLSLDKMPSRYFRPVKVRITPDPKRYHDRTVTMENPRVIIRRDVLQDGLKGTQLEITKFKLSNDDALEAGEHYAVHLTSSKGYRYQLRCGLILDTARKLGFFRPSRST